MLVKCPSCLTTYRVSEELVKSSKPAFRCSRCKLIFALELKSKNQAEAEEDKPNALDSIQRSTDREPDLPFTPAKDETGEDKPIRSADFFSQKDPPKEKEEEPSIRTSLSRDFPEPKDPSPGMSSEAPASGFSDSSSTDTPEEKPTTEQIQPTYHSSPGGSSDRLPAQSFEDIFGKPKDDLSESTEAPAPPTPESWTLEDQETPSSAPDERAPTPEPERDHESEPDREPETGPAFEPSFDELASNEERREREVALDPLRGGGPLSVIPYVSLFGFLLLAFSLITLIHQTQPERLEAYLKPLPWLGSALLKNNHLRQGVVVGSLQTGYQRILGNREVFVISGRIYNRNPVSIGEVQVEGQIHSSTGKEIARQAISVGNPISSKIIRDMTVREIAILQRLRPQKKFEVAPQASAAFTIVFLKPAKEIKSFSCRVLSAKGST